MYPRLHNHNTSSSIVIAIKIAKCPAKDLCLEIAEKSKRNQSSRTKHGQLRRMLLVVCSVDLGTHFVDIHSPMQLLISSMFAHIHASSSLTATCSCSLSAEAASSSVRSTGLLLKMKSSVFSHSCSQSAT